MVVCLISLNVLTVTVKEVSSQIDFAQLTGNTRDKKYRFDGKIDSCT
jgi:hypothetical protein